MILKRNSDELTWSPRHFDGRILFNRLVDNLQRSLVLFYGYFLAEKINVPKLYLLIILCIYTKFSLKGHFHIDRVQHDHESV